MINCLNNKPVIDLISVAPIAQQVVGLGVIIINIMQIVK